MPDVPGGGPVDPDRCLKIWSALQEGKEPGLALPEAIARSLLRCAAPVRGVFLLGGVEHCLYDTRCGVFLSPPVA